MDSSSRCLTFQRLDAGQIEFNVEPVDLATTMDTVREDVGPQAARKALALCFDVPAELPPVLADKIGLHQILVNLVGNAVKFTEHGEVRINAERTNGGIAVMVRDTGIGIAPGDLPDIFEEFRQVDNGMTRRYEGTGLGLAKPGAWPSAWAVVSTLLVNPRSDPPLRCI